MQIEINRKEFISALNVGGSMAGRVKTIPALDYAKITVKGTSMVISSFDTEVAVTKRFSIAESLENAVFCVNPKDLNNVLKSIKDENVVIKLESDTLVVSHAKGKVSLPVIDANDFPAPSKDDNATKVSMSSEMLFAWFKEGKNFVSNDEIRPIMNGVYLYVCGHEIGVASSDAHRLFHDCEGYLGGDDVNVNASITSNAIDSIMSVINGTSETDVFFGEKNTVFKTDDAMVTCRKIEGRFPDFKRIIREESPIMVRVDKAEILDSVSRVCLVADSTQRLVKLSVKGDGQIVMTGCDLGFNKSGEETLVCESASGGDLTIGVKGLSFHQCLGSIESDYVNIGLEDAKKSIVMTCDNNPRRRVVLMPVMIG